MVKDVPKGSKFCGYEKYWVQDIRIEKKVILYERAVYQLPDGTCRVAELPHGISGHYGNKLKQYIVYQNQVNNVSQTKIKQELDDFDIHISEGEIHNIIIESSKVISQEYEDIGQAGKTTAQELRVDDTGGRHKGKNGCCLVLQNDLFTHFTSSLSKSRMQFLKVLRGNYMDYLLNEVALDYIEQYKPTEQLRIKLLRLQNITFIDKSSWDKALINAGITSMNTGAQLLLHIEEAGILGSALEHGINPHLVLLSDGAPQYKLFLHAACWVHAERAIKKLVPNNDEEAEEIKKVRGDIWIFYKQLNDYKKTPNNRDKAIIEKRFDEIFSQPVNSEQLAMELRKFRLNKEDLLRVLTHPFIDLHNNSSEQAIRTMVIKQKIGGQTRSDEGRYARDIFATITKTCRKHGISVWEYLNDRINRTNKIPYLPDIIIFKARQHSATSP